MTQLPAIQQNFEPRSFNHRGPGGGWERTVTLPASGRFVEESHYVTTNDHFPDDQLFPQTDDENILPHLTESLRLYQAYDGSATLDALYANSWNRVWTPSEGGECGQGSVGNVQVSELAPDMELWFMTMMWKAGSRPQRGTRFLLSANGRHVVVIAGYETGPAEERFLGGVTPEVHAWLGTDDQSQIQVRYLADQNTPIGPVSLGETVAPRVSYRVTAHSLNVRPEPSLEHEPVGFLYEGQVIPEGEMRSDGERTWMRVDLPDASGWVSMRYLQVEVVSQPEEPRWLAIARAEMGVSTFEGGADNPRIVEYHRSTDLDPDAAQDETPWCSSFVNWCMEQANYEGTNSAWARSWLKWGKKLEGPKLGCVTVFERGTNFGHVAFYLGETETRIRVLGGNQGEQVCIAEYEKSRLLGYRWPG